MVGSREGTLLIKTRYCPHEPKTRKWRPSRSSRFICCNACYFAELRKVIVETLGEPMARRLDCINQHFKEKGLW